MNLGPEALDVTVDFVRHSPTTPVSTCWSPHPPSSLQLSSASSTPAFLSRGRTSIPPTVAHAPAS